MRHADFREVSENLPAGGHLSTASDLVRFALAFNSGRLLEPESIREMLRRPSGLSAEDTAGYYGFGIQLQILPGGMMRSHTGGQAGVSTCLYSMPDAGFAVVVLMNKEGAPARRLRAAIRDRLLGGRQGR